MNRLFNNTLFTALDYVVMIALSLVATPVLIHHLGIAGYGVFVFLSMFSFYGALSFFDFGMNGSLVTYVAKAEAEGDRRTLHELLSIGLVFYAAIGAALAIGLYLSAGFIIDRFVATNSALNMDQIQRAIVIISGTLFLQFLSLPLTAVVEGLRRYTMSKTANSALLIPQYILLMVAAIWSQRLDYAFSVMLLISCIRLIVFSTLLRIKVVQFSDFTFGFRKQLFCKLTNYSGLLFTNRLIGLVFNQLDKILCWLYLVVSSLTIYDVVVRPANLLRLVLTITNSSLIPEVARLNRLGEEELIGQLYINMVRYCYLILLPLVLVVGVYAKQLLGLWVGPELAVHWPLVLILLSVYLVQPIASVASTVVIGLERVRQTMWIAVTGTVVNIVLSLSLVGRYEIAGLLAATLAAQILMVGPYATVMTRLLGVPLGALLRPIGRILTCAIPFALAHVLISMQVVEPRGVTLATAGVVMIVHLGVNYRLLLSDEERNYLIERLHACKARISHRGVTQ
jgi:O-antigen/teichoic acid export membrane protein